MGGMSHGANGGSRQSISLAASRVRVDVAFAAVDVLIVVAAYTVGLGLRMLDAGIGDVRVFWIDLAMALPFIVAIHLVANALAGAYGRVWEYASTSEALGLVAANGGASASILVLGWAVRDQIGIVIPFSTLVVGGLLSFLMMGLVRFRSRPIIKARVRQ